jgi:hypothetical protein
MVLDANTVAQRDATVTLSGGGTGSVTVTQEFDFGSVIDVPAGDPRRLEPTYVGAFWRANQTGERIIRIPVGTAPVENFGPWTATVAWLDPRWNAGDIVLDDDQLTTAQLNARNISFTSEVAPYNNPSSAESHLLAGNATSVSGTVALGGNIIFRIGLKSTYTATEQYPARYAVVTLTYGIPAVTQKIYLRQGEDPDFLMRYTDPINVSFASGSYVMPNRPAAAKFSPYNLTAPGGAFDAAVPLRGAAFTEFPTQAGAFFQWASSNQTRFAWAPTGAVTGTWGSPVIAANTFWSPPATDPQSLIHETCPRIYTLSTGLLASFKRPNDGSESVVVSNVTDASATQSNNNIINSEMRQSLYLNPRTARERVAYSSAGSNMAWGYYADGFFDRRTITGNSTVSSSGNVAYRGVLFFNPASDSQASLFFPVPGDRTGGGTLQSTGISGFYWSSSSIAITGSWQMDLSNIEVYQYDNGRGIGYSIRCVRTNILID